MYKIGMIGNPADVLCFLPLGFSVLEFMKVAKQYTAVSAAAANAMRTFALMIDTLRDDAQKLSVSELIRRVIDVTGYGKMISEIKESSEREERLSNLDELISITDGKYVSQMTDYDDLDHAAACHWGPNAFGYIFVSKS